MGLTFLIIRLKFDNFLNDLTENIIAKTKDKSKKIILPQEVLELALRLGANPECEFNSLVLKQKGQMWAKLGAKPMAFEAIQTNSLCFSEFIWNASFMPFKYLRVADYISADKSGLIATFLGIIPIVKIQNSREIIKGELLRYLAEIPIAPDEIFCNSALEWTVLNKKSIMVATSYLDERAEIIFKLNELGQIEAMSAKSRGAQIGNEIVERPWGASFSNYAIKNGRNIPLEAEVYWIIDGKKFIYWKGRIIDWQLKK